MSLKRGVQTRDRNYTEQLRKLSLPIDTAYVMELGNYYDIVSMVPSVGGSVSCTLIDAPYSFGFWILNLGGAGAAQIVVQDDELTPLVFGQILVGYSTFMYHHAIGAANWIPLFYGPCALPAY